MKDNHHPSSDEIKLNPTNKVFSDEWFAYMTKKIFSSIPNAEAFTFMLTNACVLKEVLHLINVGYMCQQV